jgi:putative transposase
VFATIDSAAPSVGIAGACQALGLARATYYRRRKVKPVAESTSPRACPVKGRALTKPQQQEVLDALHSERFVDKAVPQVYTILLDEGVYLCSMATMYRLLRKHDEVHERRRQRRHSQASRPELLARGPNQVWSWDITKLKGPRKWSYFYLYVLLDIYSRYVVGWCIAERESAELAEALIQETLQRQNIAPGQLTLHADRGTAMTSKTVAELLVDLGVEKSHSRPHTSDDNPFSESHFKTMKYRPEVPERFGCVEDARGTFRVLFIWYNTEHRHCGIAMLTPANVHYGDAPQVIAARARILTAAYAAHPQRFVNQAPVPETLAPSVWINPPLLPVEPSCEGSADNNAASASTSKTRRAAAMK